MVETKMTLREFEIERAKKFTPVVEGKTEAEKLSGVDWGEDGWDVDEIRTEWYWRDKENSVWVRAAHMTDAIEKSKLHDSQHKAVMYRNISKEWDAYDDE